MAKESNIMLASKFLNFSTERQMAVVETFESKGIELPTKDVMEEVSEMWEGRIQVSERYVQQIRKDLKSELERIQEWDDEEKEKKKGENDMRIKGMHEWQIDLLNLANEGGWSIQQISTKMDIELHAVKDTLTTYHFMVHAQVLDEDSDTVYFEPKTTELVTKTDFSQGEETTTELVVKESKTGGGDDFWEVEIDCVSECSKVEKTVDVLMNLVSRKKAMLFMKWAKRREWLAYLVGEFKDGKYWINDLYVPDQRTCATLVDKVNASEYNEKSVVGVIHSHHEMGAGDEDNPSFSGHDANFINGNHNLSLLAGRDRETGGFKIVGIGRAKTPCGALMKIKAKVKPMPEKLEGEKELKEDFFNKCFDRGGNGNQKSYDVHK